MEQIAIKDKKRKKNTQIEGLRGIAILIIVAFHAVKGVSHSK